MNFEILIPLKPGEGLISHGSTQFCSLNIVVFAVGLQTMNNNNNKEEDEIGHFVVLFKNVFTQKYNKLYRV